MTAPAARLGDKAGAARRAVRRDHYPLHTAAALFVAAVVLLPVLALAAIALTGGGAEWRYLATTVLPKSGATTLWLLAMVALASAVTGVAAAWAIVAFDFPLRRTLAWALVLPLAVPPYLAAYAFAEFFLYTGPVQGWLRWAFGFQTIRDYWFPDIRSTGGAAFVMGSVLYPYVYMTTRIVFLMQGRHIADVARTLGASPAKVFWRVLLPVARPAIVAGSALVAMETINDIGASEYLGVQTLTVSVYSTWLNRGSLEGGAQIALVMLVLVLLLVVAEERARASQRFHAVRATHLTARPRRMRLSGVWRFLVPLAVSLPVVTGFGIPLFVFGSYASRRLGEAFTAELGSAFANSVLTAALTALLAVMLALFLINAVRLSRGPMMRAVVRMASTGYALPDDAALEARYPDRARAGLRRHHQGAVRDDPAQTLRFQHARDLCLRERLSRRAAGRRARRVADHPDRAGAGRTVVGGTQRGPRSLALKSSPKKKEAPKRRLEDLLCSRELEQTGSLRRRRPGFLPQVTHDYRQRGLTTPYRGRWKFTEVYQP